MLKIRPLEGHELPLLKDFAPPEWNTDLSATFAFHFGQPYFYPLAAELEGKIVGCAQGLLNGTCGWLGNIIVLPEARGRGVGQALTRSLVAFFHGKGCSSLLLIATPLGEPVYRKLGFVETSRYLFLKQEMPLPATSFSPCPNVRPAREEDIPALLDLDRQATGEARDPFLRRFLENARIYTGAETGELEGFTLPDLRDGPVIARTPRAGLELLRCKLLQGKTFLVAPEGNPAALDYLKGIGFISTGSAPRMVLGKEADWKPAWIFSRGAGYCG